MMRVAFVIFASSLQVFYRCDKTGCTNSKQTDPRDDLLVIRHMTHTVRAASVRHGTEK